MSYKIGKTLIKNRKLIMKTDVQINFGTKKALFCENCTQEEEP